MPVLGSPVYVKDVAQFDGIKKQHLSVDTMEKWYWDFVKNKEMQNAVDVSKMVRTKFKILNNKTKIRMWNLSLQMIAPIIQLQQLIRCFDLGLAVVLVSLVMLLFLRSFRNSLIVSLVIFQHLWLQHFGDVAFRIHFKFNDLACHVFNYWNLGWWCYRGLENIQRHLDMGKKNDCLNGWTHGNWIFAFIHHVSWRSCVFTDIILQVFVADMLKQFSVCCCNFNINKVY